ncbi:hypothetical protein SCAR479_10516 [Seiridium cardinale]|uniref:Uncharacterized protein n=1 Tax=Seiridium cardinale TaxID=138064 RepID=A0ABR2XG93_9PEZI
MSSSYENENENENDALYLRAEYNLEMQVLVEEWFRASRKSKASSSKASSSKASSSKASSSESSSNKPLSLDHRGLQEVAQGKIDGKELMLMVRKAKKRVPELKFDAKLQNECLTVLRTYGADSYEHPVADGNYFICFCVGGQASSTLGMTTASSNETQGQLYLPGPDEATDSQELDRSDRQEGVVLALETVGGGDDDNEPRPPLTSSWNYFGRTL